MVTRKAPSFCHSFATCYQALVDILSNLYISFSHLNQIHALVVTNGFSHKSVLSCRLITSYASVSTIVDARKLFDVLPKRTTLVYNHLLGAYVGQEQYSHVFTLYSKMLSCRNAPPDAVTFSVVVKACIALKSLCGGKLVHAHALMAGCVLDMRLGTDILQLYSKCGCVDFAQKLFELMPERDGFAWTTMIDGYLRSGCYVEALELFDGMRKSGLVVNTITWNALIAGFARVGLVSDALCQLCHMQQNGVRPDKVCLCTILPMFSQAAMLRPGLEAHAYVIRNGLQSDLFIASALIDMYAKCGKLELARFVFDLAEVRDTGLWNTMIAGYGMHGKCEEALHLFYQMSDSAVQLNEITFTSILSACSHGGLVDEGQRVYDVMVSDCKITARLEHLACMVDLFGRAGRLDEALAFINNMPVKPTRDMLGAFLGACRVHSNDKRAEIAVEKMVGCNLTSTDAGYGVMMSNVYAESGRWADMSKLRTQMRDGRLKKSTGCSWIEIRGAVHAFIVADESHSCSDEIYALLWNLNTAISGLLAPDIESL